MAPCVTSSHTGLCAVDHMWVSRHFSLSSWAFLTLSITRPALGTLFRHAAWVSHHSVPGCASGSAGQAPCQSSAWNALPPAARCHLLLILQPQGKSTLPQSLTSSLQPTGSLLPGGSALAVCPVCALDTPQPPLTDAAAEVLSVSPCAAV